MTKVKTPTTPACSPTTGSQDLASVLRVGNDAGADQIKNLEDPTEDQDAATKKYVDDNAGGSSFADLTGQPEDNPALVTYTEGLADEAQTAAEAYADELIETQSGTGTVITLDSLLKEYADINLTAANVSLTVAGSGQVVGSSAWVKVIADGVHSLTFSGSGWLVIRNFTSGTVPLAGTYWLFFFYTTGGVQANWPDTPPTATGISFTPGGSLAATTVQAAIQELDTEKVSTSRTINGQALSSDLVIPLQEYFHPVSTMYISNNKHGGNTATIGVVINTEYGTRFRVAKTLTVSQMAVEVTTPQASQNARLGIRDEDGDLIANSDIGNFSLASNGVVRQSFASNIILTPGLYHLHYISSHATPTFRGFDATQLDTIGITEIGSNCGLTRYSINRGAFGALSPTYDYTTATKAVAGAAIQALTRV